MIRAGVACAFLPGAGRLWVPVRRPMTLMEMINQSSYDMTCGLPTPFNMHEFFELCYKIKRHRQKDELDNLLKIG